MALGTTSVAAIKSAIAAKIQRIIPRHEAGRAFRWKWHQGLDIAGTTRGFDIFAAAPANEVPGGAYGEGIQYEVALVLRVAYEGFTDAEINDVVSADAEDIAALLVRIHPDIAGMFPIETDPGGRTTHLLLHAQPEGEEARRVFDSIFAVRYFADDTVQLEEI